MRAQTLAPIRVLRRARSFSTGRMEIWAAETKDGTWAIERLEESRTPWALSRRRDTAPGGLYGTLRAARAAIADGAADRTADQQIVEEAVRKAIAGERSFIACRDAAEAERMRELVRARVREQAIEGERIDVAARIAVRSKLRGVS